ncbi:hypothetical protein ACLB2K_075295 [Fragaria x ananassa]
MLHLAVTLYQLKRDEEAEQLALQALHIREKAFGKDSLPVAEALDCLVSIQTRLTRDDEVLLDQLKRVLSIQEKEFGPERPGSLADLKAQGTQVYKAQKQNGDVGFKKGGSSSLSVSLSLDLGKRMQTPEEKTHLFLEGRNGLNWNCDGLKSTDRLKLRVLVMVLRLGDHALMIHILI